MAPSLFQSPEEIRARYRAELLGEARLADGGITYRLDGESRTLEWGHIQRAFAAEVGEPEGVRTIVFDLVVRSGEDGFEVKRFDADPGEDAMAIARALGEQLGAGRTTASIKSVATDGLASRWYPDLESFEQEALQAVRTGGEELGGGA